MDHELQQNALTLFLQAIEVVPAERGTWIDKVCGGNEALRQTLERMLAEDEAKSGFLETPASADLDVDPTTPARIGPFKILGVLGRGGMGVVYEAEQETPRRSVALKVLRSGMPSRALLARFSYEAELLARMQHACIAQVYGAGTEETGGVVRPWIAMEIVRGSPIDEFAERNQISLNARLDLLARVADAVHHAHQRGIIHRDLKNANILVTPAGDPKVLDFGVARAAIQDVHESLRTTPGLIVGTLSTMSPEQALASADLDLRTDVYSLGAIAYELLSGRPPLELAELPLPTALQSVLQVEPPALGSLDRRLAGDIEVVVRKALEKDRDRRYASAAAFAADLRRIQAGEPVEARRPSTLYLLSKLARRHRGLVAGGVLALFATLGGLTAFALQARATARAEIRAASEARTLLAIDGYLIQDLLAAPDPRVRGRDVRVVEVLAAAEARAGSALENSPELLARVRATLGKCFFALDELVLAERNLRASLEWMRAHYGERDPRTLATEGTLIELLTARQAAAEALPLARASLLRQREVLGADDATTLTTATNLAAILLSQGELEPAEQLLRDVIARRERTLGVDDMATLLARENLATVLVPAGRIEEALAEREAAVALRTARYGELEPGCLISRVFLALERLGYTALADPIPTFETLLAQMALVFGENHHHTANALSGLGLALDRAGRTEEALAYYERAREIRRNSLGEGHEQSIDAGIQTIGALQRLGMKQEAAALAQECLAEREETTGNPVSLGLLRLLAGETELALGENERALIHLQSAQEALEGLATPFVEQLRQRAQNGLTRATRGRSGE